MGLDAQAMGIRGALMVPKVGGRYNEQIKGGQAPMITGQALNISHPLAAQKGLGYKYKQQFQKHHFPAYVVSIILEKNDHDESIVVMYYEFPVN